MIKHIVVWKLLDETPQHGSKAQAAIKGKALLEGLLGTVPTLRKAEVGINGNPDTSNFDLVLSSEFDDWAGLHAYVEHPAHKLVAQFIGEIRSDRSAVDYEF
ncbi:MAG: Dabb family protein [Clostridia bacterium]